MRLIFLTLSFFNICIGAYGQNPTKEDWKYSPVDLEDAVRHMSKLTDDSTKQWIKSLDETEYIGQVHFSQGMWIRNTWHLWKGGELASYFNSIGIQHPDDMSGIIFRCFYRELTGNPWDVEEQIEYYQTYWKNAEEHQRRMETDTAYVRQQQEAGEKRVHEFYEKRKLELPIGAKVRFVVKNKCGAFSGGYTVLFGRILEYKDSESLVEITGYREPKKANGVERCNDISGNKILVDIQDLQEADDTDNL